MSQLPPDLCATHEAPYRELLTCHAPQNCVFVGSISTELLQVLTDHAFVGPKDLYVEQKLEEIFSGADWSRSFEQPLVLIYDEVILPELLPILHQWLRRKCADIENIILINTVHQGIQRWWADWCCVHQQKSFIIQEVPHWQSPSFRHLWFHSNLKQPVADFYRHNKKITKLFSYFGGTYSKLPQEYFTLELLDFNDCAIIDYLGHFSDLQTIIDYCEHITYYKKQTVIERLSRNYLQFVGKDKRIRAADFERVSDSEPMYQINFVGPRWQANRQSWASVIREVLLDCPYSCLTEKTMTAILHHTVMIPVGFNGVTLLEKLGFWFPHDIIDYSYQHIDIFSERVDRLKTILRELSQRYSPDDLQQHYVANFDKFQYNSTLMFNYIFSKQT